MIVSEAVTGIIAIVIAYLLGSISSAYIVTRRLTGKDIRTLGGGNAGTRNVHQEVGSMPALVVGIFDIGKGAASIAIAHWLLDVPFFAPDIYVLLAGLAVVAGHIWPVYIKFRGGNGLAVTIGVLAVVLPWELLIAIPVLIIITFITRNVILSMNISLLSVLISAWFLEESWLLFAFTVMLVLIMVVNFLPTARAALAKAGSRKNLVEDVLRGKNGGR